jgi:hypothetical protein
VFVELVTILVDDYDPAIGFDGTCSGRVRRVLAGAGAPARPPTPGV